MENMPPSVRVTEISAFRANFFDLLRLAAANAASDVHIEPQAGLIQIRMRVDGSLRLLQEIRGSTYMARFLLDAKKACGFDCGKRGVPQDQRLSLADYPFDLRANLIPTLHGEKIVLRLLPRGQEFSLMRYGLSEPARLALEQALARWQGLILITGPTGSGKTSLLYAALSAIDRKTHNIHTLEDPIEYELAGICQSAVRPGELSYADALRSLMRQDPDVIMVGEIRDQATAKAAIHAAATGHLVISTIHANSALDSFSRLADLGLEAEQLTSNIIFASAQRLLPRLCQVCAVNDTEAQQRFASLLPAGAVPQQAPGCTACQKGGVRGRVLAFEYLTMTAQGGQQQPVLHANLKEQVLRYFAEGVIDATTASAFLD